MKRMLLLWVVMLVAAAAVQAQELNQKDPAAVAKAYLDACEKWDFDAASRVIQDPKETAALRSLIAEEGQPMSEQVLTEVLCMPLTHNSRYVIGDVVTTGNECRVKVTATYTRPPMLVLQKGEDDKWGVALTETILSTTGADTSVILAQVGWHGIAPASQEDACRANLKQLMLAVLMYAMDHNETMPAAETWCDDIFPYLKNTQVYNCPVNPYGYAYNSTLAKKRLDQIDKPAETITFFELDHREPNAAADPTKVKWAHRHGNGDNVAYADGHVKWLAGQ